MLSYIQQFFDYNKQQLSRLYKKVDEINTLEDKTRSISLEEFPEETRKLKEQIESGEKSLDDILPWAYALVREAARKSLNMRHFDVQVAAGIALHEGKILEQRTGEGKTLTATLPLYLNALTGKGTHLVTVNDYLARRDGGWKGKLFHALGLSTSVIISERSYLYDPEHTDSDAHDWRLRNLRPITRKEAYAADITYGINSEFGFDYLRDNMTTKLGDFRQRGFNYAIVDEADSVLIDEARTPHIISAPYSDDVQKYYKYANLVRRLDKEKHFMIDEKLRTAHLTDEGIEQIEKMLGVTNVYEKDFETLYYIEAAVKAQMLFQNDKDYIVKDGEVIIVDEFTGRLLQGRRFSEGLHQAIEAKENVAIKQESRTLATVSLQNYFRMYDKLAGMTGTAATEAEEFNKIYKTDVVVMPTHRPMVRKDEPDVIYKKVKGKFEALAEEIATHHKTGRPVLVGTTSIEKNETLSHLLKKKGIPHQLLNAKNHQKEAEIIARAGEKGAVTVATNMAGRGVDIILGGEQPSLLSFNNDETKYNKAMQDWHKKHDEIKELGGLYVIGTERHESRRIDNQLRGRSGRQGDPGETRFFVSLEDDLMRIFGGEQISKLMTFFNLPEDQPLSHGMVSKAIEQAQVKVEGHNFDIRKHLVEYDDVLSKQRDIIYRDRKDVLSLAEEKPDEFREHILSQIKEVFTGMAVSYFSLPEELSDEEAEKLAKEYSLMLSIEEDEIKPYIEDKDQDALQQYLEKATEEEFERKEQKVGQKVWYKIVQSIYLQLYDQMWTQHLTAIDDLRQGINLRGFAHLNPLIEYKNEAFSMFERLINDINYEGARRVMRVEIQKKDEQQEEVQGNTQQNLIFQSASATDPYRQQSQSSQSTQSQHQRPQPQQKREPVRAVKRPGRNDPCWCGSGKKYKKCHYPN